MPSVELGLGGVAPGAKRSPRGRYGAAIVLWECVVDPLSIQIARYQSEDKTMQQQQRQVRVIKRGQAKT
ncbi:MAG: hypothetical protein M3Q76_10590, partial [Acidobacteriota bacterium]|nr:hypothetical protein [Acidobacteriota bacterium]